MGYTDTLRLLKEIRAKISNKVTYLLHSIEKGTFIMIWNLVQLIVTKLCNKNKGHQDHFWLLLIAVMVATCIWPSGFSLGTLAVRNGNNYFLKKVTLASKILGKINKLDFDLTLLTIIIRKKIRLSNKFKSLLPACIPSISQIYVLYHIQKKYLKNMSFKFMH